MASEAFMAIIPFYGDVFRLNRSDLAAIRLIAVEADAVTDFEASRLIWTHLVGALETSGGEFNLVVW